MMENLFILREFSKPMVIISKAIWKIHLKSLMEKFVKVLLRLKEGYGTQSQTAKGNSIPQNITLKVFIKMVKKFEEN